MSRAWRHQHCDEATLTVIRNLATPGEAIELGVGTGDGRSETAIQPLVLLGAVTIDAAGTDVLRRWHCVRRKFSQVATLLCLPMSGGCFANGVATKKCGPCQHDLGPVPRCTEAFANKPFVLCSLLVISGANMWIPVTKPSAILR